MECKRCGQPAKFRCKKCGEVFCQECSYDKDVVDSQMTAILLGGPGTKCPYCRSSNLVRVD